MTARQRAANHPHFGESDRYDRVAYRIRLFAWAIILPALVAASFLWGTPDVAIASPVLRAIIVYAFVFAVMRLAGKRTLAELSTFDLVVLLIISEAVQPALVADDTRMTSALVIVMTFVAADAVLAFVKQKSEGAARVLEDIPTVLVRDGITNDEAMERERIDRDDILEAGRKDLGLETFDQIRFAILERTGGISVIPWGPGASPRAR